MRSMDQFENDVVTSMPRLRRWAARFYSDAADISDAVQDAVEQALLSKNRPTKCTVLTWMCAIVWNRFLNYRKHGARRLMFTDDPDYADVFVSTDNPHTTLEVKQALDLTGRLTPTQRRALLLSLVDTPYSEIAAELGIAEGTVKSRVHNSRRRMRELADPCVPVPSF